LTERDIAVRGCESILRVSKHFLPVLIQGRTKIGAVFALKFFVVVCYITALAERRRQQNCTLIYQTCRATAGSRTMPSKSWPVGPRIIETAGPSPCFYVLAPSDRNGSPSPHAAHRRHRTRPLRSSTFA
jgi:hypothetical protein